MTAYRRDDDGAEMVEIKPGCSVRRDVALRLGLVLPEVGLGSRRAARVADAPRAPEPIVPPSPQPSLGDIASATPEPDAVAVDATNAVELLAGIGASLGLTSEQFMADWPPEPAPPVATVPPRPLKLWPAKRSIAAILAASDRGHRAMCMKARS